MSVEDIASHVGVDANDWRQPCTIRKRSQWNGQHQFWRNWQFGTCNKQEFYSVIDRCSWMSSLAFRSVIYLYYVYVYYVLENRLCRNRLASAFASKLLSSVFCYLAVYVCHRVGQNEVVFAISADVKFYWWAVTNTRKMMVFSYRFALLSVSVVRKTDPTQTKQSINQSVIYLLKINQNGNNTRTCIKRAGQHGHFGTNSRL